SGRSISWTPSGSPLYQLAVPGTTRKVSSRSLFWMAAQPTTASTATTPAPMETRRTAGICHSERTLGTDRCPKQEPPKRPHDGPEVRQQAPIRTGGVDCRNATGRGRVDLWLPQRRHRKGTTMSTSRDVAVLVGSLRKESWNRKMARALIALAP